MEENYNEAKEENMARRRKNKKRIYIIVIIILLLVAVGVGFAVWNSYFRDNKAQEESSNVDSGKKETDTKNSNQTSDDNKDETNKSDTAEPEREKEKEEVMTYEGSNPNNADNLTGVVTYAGANGDTLVIRMNIDQYVASGSCELGVYKNGAIVYSDTANISAAASTATCEGFNVPVNSIGGGGKYQIVINVKSGDKAGVINGEVEI